MEERLFTKEEVTHIVRDRVNKLNEKVSDLELKLSIYAMREELTDIEREINEYTD